MLKRISFIGLLLLFVQCATKSRSGAWEVSSPDSRIKFTLFSDEAGTLSYNVLFENQLLMKNGKLGLESEQVNLSDGFSVSNVEKNENNTVWHQPWGENKTITDHHNELAVSFKNVENVQLTLRVRVFDDGLGFRYEYDVADENEIVINNELTEFVFAEDGKSWATPANFDTYELLYDIQPISQLKSANTPATFKTESGAYVSIHEAALKNYADMTLLKTDGLAFRSELAPLKDGTKAVLGSRFVTPWRTVQISDKAVGLINSSLILNLNEPSQIADTSWIKPVKYVGVWWGMHLGIEGWSMGDRHGATTENAKKYIDFAAKNNIEAVLYEGWNEGWEHWGTTQAFDFTKPYADFDMDEIVRYAKAKNVKIIGHHETGGNIINYENQLEKAFEWYRAYGIDMVKTGYAGGFSEGYFHHSQYAVNHYRKVVETAAKYGIMLDAHEPIKDTGIRRTYPNMMTREGVRGMEWNAWSTGNPPSHTLILPFTRMLSGPLDYTPGIFDITYENTRNSKNHKKWNDQDPGNARVHTTLAKQIANWVVLYSPMQMAADLIENYEGHPAFQFFRDFDADCDRSEALQGEPGEYVVIVRRAKDRYFLGAATNEEARTVAVPLDFLEKEKTYKAVIYADGEKAHWDTNPTDYVIFEKEVTPSDTLTVKMAAGGGQAVVFFPKGE
ncbi:MAG: glycoside hydrolase family 97 protein [Capnocytophaga sp.]|nr:glycoside hydrolase family 97 protein [Capnocytophaga sp.]